MVLVPKTQDDCLRCKGGKYLCGLSYCPIILKSKALIPVRKILPKLKNEYYGSSPPSLFVGRFGYPNIRLGPLGALDFDNIKILDEPDLWKTEFSMEDIVRFRAKLFRFITDPIKISNVITPPKIIEITQEQVQAVSPVDLEIKFDRKPLIDLSFDIFTQPMGPRVHINSLHLASTPKIDYKIDRIVNDTDLKAIDAIIELYNEYSTVTQISRIFSAGLLGFAKNRRFVPTRWSITAVDDTLGNNLRKKVNDYPPISDYLVFSNYYLDNNFLVLFIPQSNWSFDYHETWKQKSAWNLTFSFPQILTDTEGSNGRKSYATNTVGGYYATRLAVLEKLSQMKRKAAVIVFREVGRGYAIPLGVWQVRENMRKALSLPYKRFDSLNTALKYIKSKLIIPLNFYHRKSPILNQKTLDDFLLHEKDLK